MRGADGTCWQRWGNHLQFLCMFGLKRRALHSTLHLDEHIVCVNLRLRSTLFVLCRVESAMRCYKATQLVPSGVCQGAYMSGYCAETQDICISSYIYSAAILVPILPLTSTETPPCFAQKSYFRLSLSSKTLSRLCSAFSDASRGLGSEHL